MLFTQNSQQNGGKMLHFLFFHGILLFIGEELTDSRFFRTHRLLFRTGRKRYVNTTGTDFEPIAVGVHPFGTCANRAVRQRGSSGQRNLQTVVAEGCHPELEYGQKLVFRAGKERFPSRFRTTNTAGISVCSTIRAATYSSKTRR